MRPAHRITPGLIHQRAREVLSRTLHFHAYGESVSAENLLDLLLLMAAQTATLFATVRRFFDFCQQTAWNAVRANLPERGALVQCFVDALYDVANFSRLDRRRRWLVAIDVHNVPYYGQRTPDVMGGPKKQGTKQFFGYATAVLLHKRRRYTVALHPLMPKSKPHEIVRLLLDQIAAKGLKIRGVVVDSAFDSGETVLLLQERHHAYTVPLRRKGTGRNARNRCFEGRHRLVRWLEWTTEETRRRVKTRTVLWHGQPRTMVFAFQGWKGDRAHNVHQQAARQRRLYRQRFGIETSYRQKNQAQAWTTSRDPVYRLLLQATGYVLRQFWVVLTEELAREQHASASAWIAELTLRRMIDWLTHELIRLHPEQLAISLDETS